MESPAGQLNCIALSVMLKPDAFCIQLSNERIMHDDCVSHSASFSSAYDLNISST